MPSKKEMKRIDGCCCFCKEDDTDLLDSHRMLPGKDGGKYNRWNALTVCATCHRKCHSGRIEIIGKYNSTSGHPVILYKENGEEKWASIGKK